MPSQNKKNRKPTTKAQFQTFVKEFKRLQVKLGLTEWNVYFHHRETKNSLAEISMNHSGARADVTMAKFLEEEDTENGGFDPKREARHECIHLLTSKLHYLGLCRYVMEQELDDTWEQLVVRLEKIIK